MIVLVTATATVIAGLTFFERVADGFEPIPEVEAEALATVESGEPYTILLLGSDRRPNLPDERSDTTMLLRLDPDAGHIGLLSLPRDLSVSIPGYGYDRINAAYEEGGPDLVRETVELLTDVNVNEIVDTDFQGFADAVNAIGCVYVDVDQDYYNPEGTGYAAIDVNAGYQRLCGLKALQYVRYRHTDNDIARAFRQQGFLREARQRVGVRSLVFGGDAEELLNAFVDNTRSTIEGGGELRDIATTIFDLRGVTPVQVTVEGDLGGEQGAEILATDAEIERAVGKFLGTRGAGAAGGGSGAVGATPDRSAARSDRDRKEAQDAAAGLAEADPQFARYATTASRRQGFPAWYPTRMPTGTAFSRDSRTYEFENEDGDMERAYKLVASRQHPQIVTEYFGMMGTTWDDPPILRDPSETRIVGGRELLIFYSGDRMRLVGWKEGGNSYWLSNSLLGTLSEKEMIGIAASAAAG